MRCLLTNINHAILMHNQWGEKGDKNGIYDLVATGNEHGPSGNMELDERCVELGMNSKDILAYLPFNFEWYLHHNLTATTVFSS